MKRFFIIGTIFFAGCATMPRPQYTDVSIPQVNKKSTAYLGERLLMQGKGVSGEALVLGNAVGAYSSINAGTYCAGSKNSNTYFSQDSKAVTFKDPLKGTITGYADFVTYNKGENEVCPGQGGFCYDSTEISISHKDNAFCIAPSSFQQIIEYNGKQGSILHLTYREFSGGMVRQAFTTNFTMDLSQGDTVGYKGARLKIYDATNNQITYAVLRNFNSM